MNFYKIVKYLFWWLNVIVSDKGFADNQTSIETPNDIGVAEKPLSKQTISGRVDINVLKDRLQQIQNKEQKKNVSIFISFLLILGALGVFLST